MQRRDFLTGAATGAVVAAGATYLARTGPTPMAPGTAAQELADTITAMSDGRLALRLFAAGELVPAFESFDAVREGTADCSHDAPYYWVAKNKSLPFFCAVPGGLSVIEHNAWILYGGGQALWDELYAEFGVRAFMCGNTGTQMGGWYQNEINSLADFDGLNIRIPGLGAEVLNRMGATAVNMPAGEVMPALQSGVIDAAEWVGPWVDLAMGFYKVAKYYYGPGFHEGSTASELLINEDKWRSLPADLQAVVRVACQEANMKLPAEYFARSAETLDTLVNEHGVIVRHFPEDVLKRAFQISAEVNAETASEGDLNRRIYESWSSFRKRAMAYQPLSDYGFIHNRGKAQDA